MEPRVGPQGLALDDEQSAAANAEDAGSTPAYSKTTREACLASGKWTERPRGLGFPPGPRAVHRRLAQLPLPVVVADPNKIDCGAEVMLVVDPNKIDCGAEVRLNGDSRLYLVRAVRNYSKTPCGKRTKGYEVRLADDQEHAAGGYAYRWVIRTDIERKVSNKRAT